MGIGADLAAQSNHRYCARWLSPLPQALLTPSSLQFKNHLDCSKPFISYWNNLLLHCWCELHGFSCFLYLMKITRARMQLLLRTPMITLELYHSLAMNFITYPDEKRAETGAPMTALMLPGHTKMDLLRAAHGGTHSSLFYTQFLFTTHKRKLIKHKKAIFKKWIGLSALYQPKIT